MTASPDLILLPLYRQINRDLPEIPGLYATQPQGRVARGRSLDNLVIHFTLVGNAPLSPNGYKKLVKKMGDMYYKTPGSSTSAMRVVAESLNEYLFERNTRGAKQDLKSAGFLTLAVFRAGRLFLAQCGPNHVYLIASTGVTQFRGPDSVSRGLGFTKAVNIHYNQVNIESGDIMLFSPRPPQTWTTEVLNKIRGMALGKMHQRLIEKVGPELQAVLIQIGGSNGLIKVLRPEITPEGLANLRSEKDEAASHRQLENLPVSQVPAEFSIEQEMNLPSGVDPSVTQNDPEMVRPELPSYGGAVDPPDAQTPSVHTEPIIKSRPQPKPKPPREPILVPALKRIGQALSETIKQVLKVLGILVKRMLPDENMLSAPKNLMALIAIAVPIIVVAVAAMTYFQRGQGRMYEEHYLQAEYAAEVALQLSEPVSVREAWNQVLFHLNNAEVYRVNDETKTLREYAVSVLDGLDSIVRLPFQAALVDDLPEDAVIKRIVVTDDDSVLYLLNETDGHVFRATLGDRGFVIDLNFVCEPVPKPLIVGPLVDIIRLPLENNDNADIMGLDINGNLMQCIPGGRPPLTSQMPPPDMNWGTPTAMVMNSIGLYVLDPITNAVWIFWTSDGFSELPTLYFDEQVPPMGDVIDLTLNREDLFLLHADGHLTTCSFGNPTRCEDPAVMNDISGGEDRSTMFGDAVFSEIQYSPPPDPSIFLLEPEAPSIFHFSVRLTYQQQYQSQNQLAKGPATAFTVSKHHQVFLAIGNQVYYSPLP